MAYPHLDPSRMPHSNELNVVYKQLKPSGKLGELDVFVTEMLINEKPVDIGHTEEEGLSHGEDIAFITARGNTAVQRFEGEGAITEIMFDSFQIGSEVDTEEEYKPPVRKPIGIILMSPDGEITTYIYNPNTDGGPRSYSITKDWRMQTVIPNGTELRFYDHWSPKGFNNKGTTLRYYGYEVLPDETDPAILKKFKQAREELMAYLTKVSEMPKE